MKPRAASWLIIFALTFAIPYLTGRLHARSTTSDAAAAMRARYDTIRDELSDNQLEQPIYIRIKTRDERISGESSGLIEHPFETVTEVFKSADNWCDIMMLHLNVKYCRASENGPDQMVTVFVGRKHYQKLDSAHCGEYRCSVLDDRPDYFKVALTSDTGPFQTRNYRILLEAVPADNVHTFINFTYSYEFGLIAKIAQSIYFQTIGREKVGFTVVDHDSDGQPVYVDGVRGALERNIVRYHLAIKAYLDSLSVPPPQRLEKRLQDWLALTERYPLQLHELDKNEYLRMKRKEHKRLETR